MLENLLLETGLDVQLVNLDGSLFLQDQEVFGGFLSRVVLVGELGDLDFVLGVDLLERFLKDANPKLVADDIHL